MKNGCMLIALVTGLLGIPAVAQVLPASVPIDVTNVSSSRSIWITIYGPLGNQRDYGCIAPGGSWTFASGNYHPGQFTYKLRAEVKRGPQCNGETLCDTNVAVKGIFIGFALRNPVDNQCYWDQRTIGDGLGGGAVRFDDSFCAGKPGLPPGSWSQSCRRCVFAQDRLTTECLDSKNAYHAADLYEVRTCRPGSLWNDQGKLRCERTNLPVGNYAPTCRNMDFYAGELTAQCKDRNGNYIDTFIADLGSCLPPGVWNENGVLLCNRHGEPGGLVAGTYRATCRNYVMGLRGAFGAECLSRNSGWRRASIDPNECKPGTIVNDDGNLRCDRK